MNRITLPIGLIIILTIGCQNITNDQLQPEAEITITKIDPLQDSKAQQVLRDAFSVGYNKTSSSIDSLLNSIDYSEAILVQQEEDGISRYTFILNTDDALSYENLIVQVNEFDEYGAMILRYEPSIDWLLANNGNFELGDFTGTIHLLTIDRVVFNRVEMTSGEGEYIPTNQVQNKQMKLNCESGPGGNGGGGSSGEGGPESGGDSNGENGSDSTGDGFGNSDGDSGSSNCVWVVDSSGVSLIDCDYDINVVDGGMETIEEEPGPNLITKSVATCETVEAPVIGDGDVVGVDNSARFQRALNLILATELDPDLLIDLSCDELQEWLDLGTFEIDQSVLQKLDELNALNSLGLDYDIQTLQESKGATLNMDYFPVRVNQLPDGVTPELFLDILRSTFNSFLDSDITSFYGYNYNEYNLWTSDNPLGSILRFNMLVVGGLYGLDNPDDGSVITSDF